MKKMIIGKRQIVMASMVAALGLAVFVNWYYTGTDNKLSDTQKEAVLEDDTAALPGAAEFVDSAVPGGAEYFSSVKLSRTTARDEAAETLQTVIDSCDASSEAAAVAVQELSDLTNVILLETDLENRIMTKVGGECIAYVDTNSVEIVISSQALNDETVVEITDIINAACGYVEDIRISGA